MLKIQKFQMLLLCVCLIFSWKCSTDIISPEESLLFKNFLEISEQLEHAYESSSQSALDTVFMMWQQTIPPYSTNEVANFSDTIRKVYEVFESFHSPTDLDRITGGSHEKFETNFRYIVIQNNIQFAVVDTNPQYYYHKGVTSWEGVISDFRPQLNQIVFPVVYLSTQADSMIYRYLYQFDGTRKPDHQNRVAFLREAMQITHHHWIANYHKATMPIVSHIYINRLFTQALVTFRVFYQFGEAYLERSNNKWSLIYSELTAIE